MGTVECTGGMNENETKMRRNTRMEPTSHQLTGKCSSKSDDGKRESFYSTAVVLAPMVRGSELAFRMWLRSIYPGLLCYTPMLRARHIIASATSPHEDAHLFRHDIGNDDEDPRQLVVQICGSSPTELYQAASMILDKITPAALDLNLGCPQSCAREAEFGAFMSEASAVASLRAMRRAIEERRTDGSWRCLLSCKIRLQATDDDTISFAKSLAEAGVDRIAVHCRGRDAKFDGAANLAMGKKLVKELDVPVWINGALVREHGDVRQIMNTTGCPCVMLARSLLSNPRVLEETHSNRADPPGDSQVAQLAADYLSFAKRYKPPTPEYLQVHIKWIFRQTLRPQRGQEDYKNWRHRLWNFLRRPYLQSLEQFRYIVALFVAQAKCCRPESLRDVPEDPTYNTIRHLNKNAGRLEQQGSSTKKTKR